MYAVLSSLWHQCRVVTPSLVSVTGNLWCQGYALALIEPPDTLWHQRFNQQGFGYVSGSKIFLRDVLWIPSALFQILHANHFNIHFYINVSHKIPVWQYHFLSNFDLKTNSEALLRLHFGLSSYSLGDYCHRRYHLNFMFMLWQSPVIILGPGCRVTYIIL